MKFIVSICFIIFIYRVGRTARAGKAGRSVAFVTQYDVEAYQRLEALIGQKLPQVSYEAVMIRVIMNFIMMIFYCKVSCRRRNSSYSSGASE